VKIFLQVSFISCNTFLQQCIHLCHVACGVPRECDNRTRTHYNRFPQRANGYGPFNYHTNKLTSRVKQYEELEDKTDNKRIKLSSEEAQRFGIAFGAAWKAAH
jgi:hypothetical protein